MTDATKETREQGSVIGGWICLVLGMALMFWSQLYFYLYLPLFFASFVLGIVAIVQNRILHGILILLLSIVVPLVIGFGLSTYHTQQAVEPKEKTINVINSRFGEIKVVEVGSAMGITLNDKFVSKLKNDSIDIEKYFQLRNADVVLVSLDCGGSGCGHPYYVFITIKPDSSYSLTEEIFDIDKYTVEQEGEAIIIKENIDYGEGKIVTYSNGSITEKPRVVWTTGTVSEERCKGLFELYEECYNKDEADQILTGVGVFRRNYVFYTADKRVNEKEFDKICNALSKTKKPINYDQFKKSVCITN